MRPGKPYPATFRLLYHVPMSASPTVRGEIAADVEPIRVVHQRAFPTDAEARLVDELRAAGHLSITLVALIDDQVVGHIALSPVTIDGTQVGLGLAPVAVVPEHQRSGIGSKLVRQSLATCRANDVDLVVVLGEPEYYSRFGFVTASAHGLRDTYGGGDAFQVVFLSANQPTAGGLVQYAPEFALFE